MQKAKDGQALGMDHSGYGLKQAERAFQDAQLNYERMKDLYEAGAVSKQQFEQAETALTNAQIALEQAKLQENNASSQTDIELAEQTLEQAKVGLANAQQQLQLAEIGIKQAQVGIDSNALRVKQAESHLADSKIIAPISGEVTAVHGGVGDVISSSSPFTTIVDVTKLNVEAQLSAEQSALFQNGQEVQVEIPSLNERFTAKITYLSNVANEAGFYPLEASVQNHEGKIKPGMIAKIIHETKVSEEALLVPTNAVIEKGSQAFIFVVKDGKAVQTPVTIIQAQTELTAIAGKGLSEKDQIVTKGQNTLADGNKVRIIEGETK